jgi:large subunit ribosomal protein L25
MESTTLSTQKRDTTKTNNALRAADLVPCVVYGNETENTSIMCDYNTLYRVYAKAGESTVIDLDIDGKTLPVLVHAIDFHPVTDRIIHVDFYAVNLKKKIQASVPLNIVGVSPAVKEAGGVLLAVRDHVTVECLPKDLPHVIDLDISVLVDFETVVHVSDLTIPTGVGVLDEQDLTIATVQQPRSAVEAEGGAAESAEGEAAKATEEPKAEA